jgi:hypothetical protein
MMSFFRKISWAIAYLFLFSTATPVSAQFEIGLFGGGFNYQGDLDYQTKVIAGLFVPEETRLSYGILARYTPIPKLSVRAHFLQSRLIATDRNSPKPIIRYRGFAINTAVREFAIMGEWNFLGNSDNNNFHAFSVIFNPYVFTGLGVAMRSSDPTAPIDSNPYPFPESGNTRVMASLPVGVGAKLQFTDNLSVGFDIGSRMVLGDYLDGISKMGSPSRDWYIFGGLSLTYCISNY